MRREYVMQERKHPSVRTGDESYAPTPIRRSVIDEFSPGQKTMKYLFSDIGTTIDYNHVLRIVDMADGIIWSDPRQLRPIRRKLEKVLDEVSARKALQVIEGFYLATD